MAFVCKICVTNAFPRVWRYGIMRLSIIPAHGDLFGKLQKTAAYLPEIPQISAAMV